MRSFPRWQFPILAVLGTVFWMLIYSNEPDPSWHPGYSFILGLLAATVTYELVAIFTQYLRRKHGGRAFPTITESVRRLDRKWRWTGIVGTIVFAVLIIHFWWEDLARILRIW